MSGLTRTHSVATVTVEMAPLNSSPLGARRRATRGVMPEVKDQYRIGRRDQGTDSPFVMSNMPLPPPLCHV